MDPLVTILVASLGLLSAALSRQLSDEFKAWAPSLAKHLIARAVRKLPEQQRARYLEEWSSDVDDTPGEIGKILKAFGYGRAATSMAAAFFGAPTQSFLDEFPKRAFDVVLSAVLLVLEAPVMIATCLALFIECRGPIFHRRPYMGRYGATFYCLAFRTERRDGRGRGRFGTFAHRWGLAELPTLINIFRGEMSFIGPAPHTWSFASTLSELFPGYSERHRVRPGITGLSQISHISGITFVDVREATAYDLAYVRDRHFAGDMRILLKSFWIVVGVPRIFRALGLTRKGHPRT
jgi:lipopolysaccharide/colanic/teichoic acid biosynthesis glycosyltransferase